MIDTNIAIHLRDGDERITERFAELPPSPYLSVVSRVELESGVHRVPGEAELVRARLKEILADLIVLPFETRDAEIYGRIVEACGYSRPKLLDRMIAAQAMGADATLVTINEADFRNVPGLKLEIW